MTPEEYRQTPFYKAMLTEAQGQIAKVADVADELLEQLRPARVPGQGFIEYERRVANIAMALSVVMAERDLAVLVAVLLERLAAMETLDLGVPG